MPVLDIALLNPHALALAALILIVYAGCVFFLALITVGAAALSERLHRAETLDRIARDVE